MAYLLYVIEFPNGKRYFGITGRTLKLRRRGHLDDVVVIEAPGLLRFEKIF